MRFDYNDKLVGEETVKNDTFNHMRTEFSRAVLKRYHGVKGVLENIWDLDNTKALLSGRLQTIAAKDPETWTAKNLIDMALISCLLWNGVDDEVEEPVEE
jgi:hypothetical protein